MKGKLTELRKARHARMTTADLFQKTKLWEQLVVLTEKVKKPRSQKKKQEVIKKMVYCVKMSILESFL